MKEKMRETYERGDCVTEELTKLRTPDEGKAEVTAAPPSNGSTTDARMLP
jgi:hypothetical protein